MALNIYFKGRPNLEIFLITEKSHSNPLYSYTVLKRDQKNQQAYVDALCKDFL